MRTRYWWFLATAVAAVFCCAVMAEEGTWQAGLAKANITPTESIWMGGYAARTRPAEGKLQDLWV